MNQISENLLTAIDILIQERLKDLPFDKTIVGTIVDTNIEQGYCNVLYQGLIFPAYSDRITDLNANDTVYVLIPQNDVANKRFIIGKLSSFAKEVSLV